MRRLMSMFTMSKIKNCVCTHYKYFHITLNVYYALLH